MTRSPPTASLAGTVYSADLDGKNECDFLSHQGNLTGIAYAEL
jgi:hypothetical protein